MSSNKPPTQLAHTRRLHIRPLRMSAALAVIALALTACGSGNSGAPSETSATEAISSPTKDEVKAGFVTLLDEGLSQLDHEITDEVRENYTQCLADEAYDDLSPEGRTAVAYHGDNAVISNPDRVTISQASTACRKYIDALVVPGSKSTISRAK